RVNPEPRPRSPGTTVAGVPQHVTRPPSATPQAYPLPRKGAETPPNRPCSSPQQAVTLTPSLAQAVWKPTLSCLKAPFGTPSLTSGASPQHTTCSSDARMAQAETPPMASSVNWPAGGCGAVWPLWPQHVTSEDCRSIPNAKESPTA